MIYLPREWQLVAGGLHAAEAISRLYAFCRLWLKMIHQVCADGVQWLDLNACCAGRTRYLAAVRAVIAVIVAKCLFKYRRVPPHRRRCRRCRRAVYLLIFLLSPLQLHAAPLLRRHAGRGRGNALSCFAFLQFAMLLLSFILPDSIKL